MGKLPWGNIPGGYVPRGETSRGECTGVERSGGNFPGGIFRGGICLEPLRYDQRRRLGRLRFASLVITLRHKTEPQNSSCSSYTLSLKSCLKSAVSAKLSLFNRYFL